MVKVRFNNKMITLAETVTMFAIDVVSLIAIFYLSGIIRTKLLPYFYADFPLEFPHKNIIRLWWIFLLWVFFFYYEGLYTKRFSFWDEVRILWKASFFSAVGIFAIVSVGKLSGDISRTLVVLMGVIAVLLFPLIRMGAKKILRQFGFFCRRVLILGAGETGKLIAKALQKESNYGYKVIGFLDDDPEKVGKYIDGVKIHRGVDRAATYLKTCAIADLIIAMPGAGKERIKELVNDLQHKVNRMLFVPDMFGVAVLGTSLQHFFHEQAFAFELRNNLSLPINIFIKKCFDLLFICFAILFLFIPMAIIALAIRLNSRGHAIFSQERVGKDGKLFKCFKFRTMYEDAEDKLREVLEKDAAAKKEWEQYWKLKDDPRITRMGRFLRRTSLDELPQIFNVMMGQMSLVGPRPVTQEEISKYYKDMAKLCFCVLPGITGLWQVSGRSNTTYDYRIALDCWYVRNWNLWLDIIILFKTIRVFLRKEGAY